MKKIFSVVIWSIFIFSFILISLSLAVTHKTFYSFIFKSFLDIDPSFYIAESNWHPIKPSILLTDIKSENDRQSLSANEIFIQFSLLNISRGNFVTRLRIDNILIQNHLYSNQPGEFFSLVKILRSIDKLNINNLKINLPDDTNLLNLSLDSSQEKREPKLNLYLKDKHKNILEVGILSSEMES